MPPISDIVQRRLRGALVLSPEQIDEVFGDPAQLRQRQQAHDMSPASPCGLAARRIVGPRAHQHASSSGSTPPAGTGAGPSTRAQDRGHPRATAPGPNQPMTSTTTTGPARAAVQRDDDDDDRSIVEDNIGNESDSASSAASTPAQTSEDETENGWEAQSTGTEDLSSSDDTSSSEGGRISENESEGEGGNDSDSTAASGPIEVFNPFARHTDPFTLHGTTFWNYMVTPPLYYVSRHSWKGIFRFVCKITDAKLARTYPNTVREKIMVAFDDFFEMKLWACAGSQLYSALGSERKLFGIGALVVLENVDVVWKRNERVTIFGTGSNIARLDGNEFEGLSWRDVVSFNERLNDGVDGVRSLGRIRS